MKEFDSFYHEADDVEHLERAYYRDHLLETSVDEVIKETMLAQRLDPEPPSPGQHVLSNLWIKFRLRIISPAMRK